MQLNGKSTSEIMDECRKVHNNQYDYLNIPPFIGCNTKLSVVCKIHGLFIQRTDHHLNGSKCPRCANSFHKTSEEFISEVKKFHGDRFDCSKVRYKNSRTPVILTCKLHGDFTVLPKTATGGKCPCLKCMGRVCKDTESFIRKSRNIHGNIYDYSLVNYITAKTPVKIVCKKHGIFEQTPDTHTRSGCPKCNCFRTSLIEREWFKSLNLPNLKYNFHIKVGNKSFYVDGFDVKTNTAYEFNGDYFHGNPAFFFGGIINRSCKRSYGELYTNTIEKEKLLKSAGYNVISIWESDYLKSIGKTYKIKPHNHQYFEWYFNRLWQLADLE